MQQSVEGGENRRRLVSETVAAYDKNIPYKCMIQMLLKFLNMDQTQLNVPKMSSSKWDTT